MLLLELPKGCDYNSVLGSQTQMSAMAVDLAGEMLHAATTDLASDSRRC